MKFRILLSLLATIVFVFAACSDDDPVAPVPTPPLSQFNTSNMPITTPGSTVQYGNMSTDGAGNLLFTPAGTSGVLFTVLRSSGVLRIVAANIGIGEGGPFPLMSSVYDPTTGLIYVGTTQAPTRIYAVDPADGSHSLLIDLGSVGTANDLLIAPAGFGAYGGHLIICTYSPGALYAVDLSNPVSSTQITTGQFNSGVFGSDGTLYCTTASGSNISTVSATGTVASFTTMPVSGLDGITFDSSGGRLFVASSDVDSVYAVSVPGGTPSRYTAANFDAGWWPSGLIYDNGKLLAGVDSSVGPRAYVIADVTP